ncbi:AraC family transcriptional regulator ligand-binding domain-containing protein [Nocardia sp. NPDC050406]|uniref:AraC family transcriptional regulator ligand-binding domain-containing protein n=1 Tax=Nocardia sp. NPDC050406 TaxID=3364318 RepID=UPI00378E9D83
MSARSEWSDSILMARFVLERAARAGVDAEALARAAGVPGWTEGGEDKRVSRRHCTRLWELLERARDPGIALRSAGDSVVGELGLIEYLFLSAPTLGAGLDTCSRHSGCLTTSYGFREARRGGRTVTYELLSSGEDGRGRELVVHAAFALLVDRARTATGRRIDPVRVAFRQRPPRLRADFVDVFGTGELEFDAEADTVTLRVTDLDLPLTTADPALATVLLDYAAALPPPAEFATSWVDRVAAALDRALAEGPVTLDAVAQRLHTSPRSLQRRLAESGTGWRRELDAARRRRLAGAAELPRAQQAKLLGYSDPASLRRSVQRWRDGS